MFPISFERGWRSLTHWVSVLRTAITITLGADFTNGDHPPDPWGPRRLEGLGGGEAGGP